MRTKSTVTRTCRRCGKEFSKKPSDVRRGLGFYCSPACYHAPAARFWARVDSSSDGCWEWQGPKGRGGYGKASINRKTTGAHRVAWVLTFGAIPEGMQVRHFVCDNRPCCNPAHLRLGTLQDNMDDKVAHGRAPKGDDSGPRKHPDRMRRGATHPRYGRNKGADNPRSRISAADVATILRLHSEGIRIQHIANQFRLGWTTVSHIVKRESWQSVHAANSETSVTGDSDLTQFG